ncbi:MAG TPA: PAS domain S-box protein [Moraxellaceae bacterium]|nr:PAS domain S-box protein [Moraxellaceae bacterium]
MTTRPPTALPSSADRVDDPSPDQCRQRYRALFHNHIHAIAHCRVICDAKGEPVDFLVEEVNDACAELMGLRREDMENRAVTVVLPGFDKEPFPFITHLGLIGLNDGEDRFEAWLSLQQRWFSVYAFGHGEGRFTVFFTDITAAKATEARLVETERRFHALFNNPTNPMIHCRMILGPDGKPIDFEYVAVNEATCTALRKSRDELEGRRYSEIFPDAPKEYLLERFGDVALKGEDKVFDTYFPLSDRHFHAYAFSVSYGKFTALYTDITEQRKTEEHLRASEQLLRATFDQAAIGIVQVGPDGRFMHPNRKFCDMMGYSEEELRHLHFVDLTYAPDKALGVEEFQQTRAGMLPSFSLEKRYARRDGTPLWCQLTVTAVRNPDTNAIAYNICIIEDIRQRKQAEDERERLLARLREAATQSEADRLKLMATFSAMSESILICDMQRNVILNNPAFAALYSRGDHLAMPAHLDAFAQTIRVLTLEGAPVSPEQWPINAAFEGKEVHDREIRIRWLGSSHEMIIRMSALPVFDAEGRQALVVAVLREVTAQKQMEAELLAARDELEIRVQQRTAELNAATQAAEAAQKSAENARRAAESANRAKSEFLAAMSHEIRTPLNSVIGFAGLLQHTALNAEQRELVELGRRSGESLLHLLNDLLDFSKIEAGHLDLEQIDFDPHLEVDYALSLVQDAANSKRLHLHRNVTTPRHVRGDPARLRQILLNLLSNGVKFTEKGEVGVRCSELSRRGDRIWLRFEIHDTGIGIDEATIDRLFQPFVQGDASTTRRYGGTGLGLVISKRLVDAMGGRIEVSSKPGVGSTFRVDLPFGWVAAPPAAPVPADAAPVALRQVQGRVLVVEDNPVNQLMACKMLGLMGLHVDVAGNGAEALASVQRSPYDLILMDCDMPVMDGFEATRAIRALEPPYRQVPIVAMTASALKDDRSKCLEAGMADFVSKPVRLEDMAKVVERWLANEAGTHCGEVPQA